MSKVRINDLARELEVKSRAVLDALTDVGVTEKKTHSSSLEADEAERVREFFQRGGARSSSAGARAAAPSEPKPKIDLSRISKPGDVLKAVLQQKEEAAKRFVPSPPVAVAPKPVIAAPVVKAPEPTVVKRVEATPAAKPPAAPASVEAKPAPRRIVPQPRQAPPIVVAAPPASPAIASKTPSGPVIAKAPVHAAPPTHAAGKDSVAAPETRHAPVAPASTKVEAVAATSAPATQSEPGNDTAVEAAAAPVAAAPVAAPPPVKRVIMPQTGPRPVYTAPPPSAVTPPQNAGNAGGGLQRGRPIFERPRPQQGGSGPGSGPGFAPGSRPGMGPGARRPMHPTRQHPTGTGAPGSRPPMGGRPGFGARPGVGGAPGALPVPGPGDRPARSPQQRRGGQKRYEKSKEGPMKGFVPPPRFGGSQISHEPLPITRSITVTEGTSVKDLAEKLGVRGKDLIALLLTRGVFVTVNQSLDAGLVKEVAAQFGADAEIISHEDQMEKESIENLLTQENLGELEVTRPPVVTVMGHVDHGKTSLLDAIRETDVAAGEAGGITQHIGAYKVRIAKPDSPAFGREIVFLDTPGHEAFTRMRARGAKVTDIVVVVVAADDGVMPQTLEAIDHAKAANVPIIVAVNKIDKPEAQPDRVKQQLGDRGLVPEAWGGSTVFVDVSAKKRINLDLLLEMICLVADIGNLRATPDRSAVGTVIESKLDRGRGAVSTVLVQNGTLKLGDSFIVGNTFGKIRAMFDDHGRAIEDAGPSTPVEILGLEGIPDAGDVFLVVADRDKAKGIAQYRKMKDREAQLAKSSRVSLEGLAEQIKQAGTKELPIILKGDVQGSVEVLAESLQGMSTDKVRVKVIHTGVGAITESDILLASASNAIVIGFNVRPERKGAELAEQEGVDIRLHSIIYELQDEMKRAMLGLLEPTVKETAQGRAEILNVFRIPKVGTIAGCTVTEGYIRRDSEVRLMRDGVQVYKGKLSSLKRFKDDVNEVRSGMECGMAINNFNDIKVGDVIDAFSSEKIAAELGTLTGAGAKA
ncbi:MAG TPA: translation initiation factor IF-2 [Acidobacteriaceae bacterium]|jgi:translation initiation factor IF-2|nr:translation initiation factor IF-2 [Acidobacteriaceae bacterium]